MHLCMRVGDENTAIIRRVNDDDDVAAVMPCPKATPVTRT